MSTQDLWPISHSLKYFLIFFSLIFTDILLNILPSLADGQKDCSGIVIKCQQDCWWLSDWAVFIQLCARPCNRWYNLSHQALYGPDLTLSKCCWQNETKNHRRQSFNFDIGHQCSSQLSRHSLKFQPQKFQTASRKLQIIYQLSS